MAKRNSSNLTKVSDDDGLSFISDISSISSASEYSMEYLMDKRFTDDGDTEYFVKWKDYGLEDNTWELEKEIINRTLIDNFEENLKLKKTNEYNVVQIVDVRSTAGATPGSSRSTRVSSATDANLDYDEVTTEDAEDDEDDDDDTRTGFEKGWTPSEILGVTKSTRTGELVYAVKWEDMEEVDLIASKVLTAKCPHLLIDFFERRITWRDNVNERR